MIRLYQLVLSTQDECFEQGGDVMAPEHMTTTITMTICNGDVSYDEGSLQEVRTVTMTMTDVECLRLI